MSDAIDITGIDKAAILAALYNRARVQGMGALHRKDGNMTIEEARATLAGNDGMYFDYLHGRVMKVDLNTDELRVALYDRDNGPSAARFALEAAGLIASNPAKKPIEGAQ